MTAQKPELIIPVENQVREFDPKLLLACVAARRGFAAVIGSRPEVDFRIASFPRGIYLCKSMTVRSLKMFRIMRRLGHEIVTWDEEALVHLPPEVYFSRRLSDVAIRYVSHLFAWGQDNADLWRQYPQLPPQMPIHVTGNPRGDLLRPEMHPIYAEEVEALRNAHGDFILINTNFNHVNAFYPGQNLFQPVKNSAEEPRFGRAARGMSREYAEGLRSHKQANFENFKKLIPKLEHAFPEHTIIVRPHPNENHDIYRQIASRCQRVRVTNEGNVIPWLLATRVLVHNCCTTGVEAYAMGVPAVTYRVTVNEVYDDGFYRLPNRLSHQAFDFEELQQTLARIFAGELGPAGGDERKALFERYLAAQEGPLACERIVDVVYDLVRNGGKLPDPGLASRLSGWFGASRRRLVKWLNTFIPGSQNRPEFQNHRYPGISLEQLQERIARFQEVLGDSSKIKVTALSRHIYRIHASNT